MVGAFALGYAIGEGLKYAWREIQPSQRAYRAALAFRQARVKFKEQYGRDPNRAEVQQLAQGFREALARLK